MSQPASAIKREHDSRWLRDDLRAELLRGGLLQGHLPSEQQLMSAFGVPRSTVRAALSLLRHEGLVERIRGTGTVAADSRQSISFIEHHGVNNDVMAAVDGASSRLLAMETVPMPRYVALQLDEEPRTPCLMVEYVYSFDGESVGVVTNYVRIPEADALRTTEFVSDWFEFLRAAGLEIGRTEFLIDAAAADPLVAAVLDVIPGRPLIGMQRVIHDHSGRPYGFAVIRNRADRISLVSWDVSGTPTSSDT